jgi:mannosyltransferase
MDHCQLRPGPFLSDRDELCSRAVKTEPCESTEVAIGTRGAAAFRLRLWLALAVTLATALRLFRLGTKSFWLDEATSAVLAQVDRHVFLGAIIHRQANMVLYYLLLRGWIRLGSSEFVMRCLSVIAGVAAIPAIYLLGTRLFGPRAGRVAALLLSVHAFHIRYSQEARAYSLFMLLAVVSSLFFLRSLERPSRRNWAAYILVSTLMVYAQVFGGWMLLAQWIAILFLRREVRWKQFLFSAALICFLISPLAYCLLFVSDRSQLYWATKPTLEDLYKFCLDMTGDGGPLLLSAYLALVAGGVAAGVSRLRSHSATADIWKYWFLLFWLILPPALILAISLRWPAFEARFLICCVPPLVLLVADAVTRIRSQVLFAVTLMILLGLSLSGTYSYYRGRADAEHTDDWRDATRYILSQAEAGDAVLFSYSEERLAFDEYQRQFHATGSPIHEFPEDTDLELLTLRPSRPSAELLDNIVAGYRRVWVISAFQPNRASRQAEAALEAHFHEHGDRSFGFVHADLFADRIPRPPDQRRDRR